MKFLFLEGTIILSRFYDGIKFVILKDFYTKHKYLNILFLAFISSVLVYIKTINMKICAYIYLNISVDN